MWPYIQISIIDEGGKNKLGIKKKGCENMFTTISLIDYCYDENLIEEEDYIYA